MCEDATVLKKTFALTAQRRKGTIVILDLQAKNRRIPARIISNIVACNKNNVNFQFTLCFAINPHKSNDNFLMKILLLTSILTLLTPCIPICTFTYQQL
jgi:hypothetical protein